MQLVGLIDKNDLKEATDILNTAEYIHYIKQLAIKSLLMECV